MNKQSLKRKWGVKMANDISENENATIKRRASGINGFGYDPIFFLPEINQTMAHLSKSEKSKYSESRGLMT